MSEHSESQLDPDNADDAARVRTRRGKERDENDERDEKPEKPDKPQKQRLECECEVPQKKGRNDKEGKDKGEDEQPQQEEKPDKKEPPKPPFYKRPVPMILLGGVLLLVIVVGVIWWLHARQFESTDDAFIDGHIVAISPNVAATVARVYIDDNDAVHQGELLVKLDPRDFQTAVDQKQANLAAAQSALEQAKVQLEVARANVGQDEAASQVAKTNADNAERDYQRWASLSERSRSDEQLDNASAAKKSTAAQLLAAQAKLKATRASVAAAGAQIQTAQADIERAAAELQQAKINLAYCEIRAPVAGRITRKSVEPGAYVETGQPLFSIVPTDVWVTANYKETQLERIRVGEAVTVKVDAYPHHVFHAKVDSIQNGSGSKFSLLPAENATGNFVKVVQRVPVKIVFDPGELSPEKNGVLLAPGMSVVPRVRVR